MPYATPQELAKVRPIDIVDQAMFDDMIRSIPRPVPPEWRDQFNRLSAISRRHGFAWPYQRLTRKAGKRPPEATPRPAHTFVPPEPPPAPAREALPPDFRQVKPPAESYGHLAFCDGYEYFQYHDSYVYRAPIGAPFDAEGYRQNEALVGSLHQARQLLGLD